ncbi:hypothetical protein FB45DRAFT_1050991 [Roridomyces roridus]|uniref:F-box domain-containing protein n=1 Tax=Roridomyces roridus TaxID=1738132 RepID=A0AAD7CL14_9AGAR|nr:hypothetical protein FB45DRAFT_1050991 [Roridomyces roridus]
MDDLPNELLDRICSFMHTKELCTTMHISSSLRRVASPHLLSDVRAGTVTLALSKSLHLILFVAHICPIQRLECFANSKNMRASEFRRLAPILGATAPIPDILIHDNLEDVYEERRSLPLHLFVHLPQTATDTLFIITRHSTYVSRPRFGPPPSLVSPPLPKMTIAWLCVGVFLDIYMWIFCAVYDLCSLLWWLFRRLVGLRWSVEERVSADVSDFLLHFGGGIRVRIIEPLRDIPDSVYSTCLASPDFQFTDVKVDGKSHMTFADLVAFVARQEELRSLACSTNSIRSFSLLSASPPHFSSKIAHLTAPASYIPHLLPLAPHVERIFLSFPSLVPTLRVIHIGPQFFRYATYCTALNAIARLPGSHLISLSFIFNLTVKDLPWQMNASDAPQPETQLYRVEHLMLRTSESACYIYMPSRMPTPHAYTASTIHALAPWLACFPSMRRVSFDEGAVENMSQQKRLEVAEAIAMVCTGMRGVADVAFQIPDEERMGARFGEYLKLAEAEIVEGY